MSGVDLAGLRRLAEQATPGPWAWEQVRKFRDGAYGDDWVKLDRNHKFIAACDPGTVLALVGIAQIVERWREAYVDQLRHEDGALFTLCDGLYAATTDALAPFTVALGEGDRAAVSSSPSAGDDRG